MATKTHPKSLKIARVFGVDLNLHWSLSVLLFYVVLLSAAQFPGIVQQAGMSTDRVHWNPWLFGLCFALGLFASVIAHEIGHVLVAQSQGVRVQGITLMMLGGVSEIGPIPEKAYAELKFAVIGPLVSLVISGAMWVVYKHFLSELPELSLWAYWLANINLVLALFNLIPALPLDGGRVLRSFLAVKQGNLKATQNSVKISHFFAWTFGMVGFLELNFFLILIAFFVYSAAQAELISLATKTMLSGVRVGEAMTRITPLAEDTTLQQAALEMLRTRNQILPVISASGDYFLLSLASIRGVPRNLWPATPVKEAMLPAAVVLNVNDPINQAIAEITSNPVQALPVSDNGQIVGLLKYADLSDLMQFKSLEDISSDEKKAA